MGHRLNRPTLLTELVHLKLDWYATYDYYDNRLGEVTSRHLKE